MLLAAVLMAPLQSIASAVSGLMASGLLQLAGKHGLFGWKWLFLVDGIITLVISILTYFYLPKNASSTKGGIRGWKPWFSERETQIAVTRVIRDDPAKRYYETVVAWKDVKDAVTDFGLWGHLIITAVGLTPTTTISTCELPALCQRLSITNLLVKISRLSSSLSISTS